MAACGQCVLAHHDQCANELVLDPVCDCTHESVAVPILSQIGASLPLPTSDSPTSDEDADTGLSEVGKPRTRRLKDNNAVTDQLSTGRKRAAALYPLKDADGNRIPCDFANRKSVLPNYMEVQIDGCGVRPGTLATHAQARHHNNYDTLDNERDNVALICNSCHNLLHARNDPFKDKIYERIYGFKPAMADLSHAAKALRSGVVSGGKIKE